MLILAFFQLAFVILLFILYGYIVFLVLVLSTVYCKGNILIFVFL